MAQASCTSITKDAQGRFTISWADGFTWGPMSLENIKEIIGGDNPVDSPENTKRAFLAYWLHKSADGSNTANIVNKTLTFDLSAQSPWRIQ